MKQTKKEKRPSNVGKKTLTALKNSNRGKASATTGTEKSRGSQKISANSKRLNSSPKPEIQYGFKDGDGGYVLWNARQKALDCAWLRDEHEIKKFKIQEMK